MERARDSLIQDFHSLKLVNSELRTSNNLVEQQLFELKSKKSYMESDIYKLKTENKFLKLRTKSIEVSKTVGRYDKQESENYSNLSKRRQMRQEYFGEKSPL